MGLRHCVIRGKGGQGSAGRTPRGRPSWEGAAGDWGPSLFAVAVPRPGLLWLAAEASCFPPPPPTKGKGWVSWWCCPDFSLSRVTPPVPVALAIIFLDAPLPGQDPGPRPGPGATPAAFPPLAGPQPAGLPRPPWFPNGPLSANQGSQLGMLFVAREKVQRQAFVRMRGINESATAPFLARRPLPPSLLHRPVGPRASAYLRPPDAVPLPTPTRGVWGRTQAPAARTSDPEASRLRGTSRGEEILPGALGPVHRRRRQ